MIEQIKEAVLKDFPDIEYSLLYGHFLRTITDWQPEWAALIITGPGDMQYWHEHLLPANGELAGWHQIYLQHPQAKGYIYRKGKLERHTSYTFFSQVYSTAKG